MNRIKCIVAQKPTTAESDSLNTLEEAFNPELDEIHEPAKKARKIWKNILIIFGCFAGVLALIAGAGLFYVYSAEQKPTEVGDLKYVIHAGTMAEYYEGFTPKESAVSFHRIHYFDGSRELEYKYEEQGEEGILFLNTTVSYDKKKSDTITGYEAAWIGLKASFVFVDGKLTLEDRAGLFKWGDRSRFGILNLDGDPIGNYLLARKGKMTYMVVLSGLYFDKKDTIKEVFKATLDKAAAFKFRD